MSVGISDGLHSIGAEEVKRNWAWFLALGIIFVVIGMIALIYDVIATVIAVEVFGWLLIFGGGLAVGHAFLRRRWGGFFLELVLGILDLVIGLMLVGNPGVAAVAVTLVIAVFLFVGGIFRIVTALSVRFPHWQWMLLNGVISLLLGLMIWQQWPFSGLWVIGLFVGIDLIFYGWSLIMLGLTARRVADGPG